MTYLFVSWGHTRWTCHSKWLKGDAQGFWYEIQIVWPELESLTDKTKAMNILYQIGSLTYIKLCKLLFDCNFYIKNKIIWVAAKIQQKFTLSSYKLEIFIWRITKSRHQDFQSCEFETRSWQIIDLNENEETNFSFRRLFYVNYRTTKYAWIYKIMIAISGSGNKQS